MSERGRVPSYISGALITVKNGWKLLDDRLGIEVDVQNPEEWATGNPLLKAIRGVTWWANPASVSSTGSSPISITSRRSFS